MSCMSADSMSKESIEVVQTLQPRIDGERHALAAIVLIQQRGVVTLQLHRLLKRVIQLVRRMFRARDHVPPALGEIRAYANTAVVAARNLLEDSEFPDHARPFARRALITCSAQPSGLRMPRILPK